MAKVSKNELDVWRSICVPNTLPLGSYKFWGKKFEHGSSWHQPEREQEQPINVLHLCHRSHQQRCTGLAREECLQRSVSGCEGKITLFSFPTNPVLRGQWTQFVFRGSNEIWQVFCTFSEECFTNKAQVDVVFADCLILKDGAVHCTLPAVFREKCKAVSFFYTVNLMKLESLWWYEGCNPTIFMLKINMRLAETVCVMSSLMLFCTVVSNH